MRTTAALSAILAASAVTQAAVVTTEPQITTVSSASSASSVSSVVPPPLSTGHTGHHGNGTTITVPCSTPYPISSSASGAPIPSGNSTGILTTGTGLPPVPTTTNTAVPTAGAALTTQNSMLAMGVAVVMASLML
ncbi:hypothetical protein VFPPC_13055 [Pochonia chlamydosporia 170]|uniref:Uncharacterized protein n=1 Tax=Pochonia chlamydosporia 170 TaxID=1380566 RepID=A0A179G942_METCM|nr:hypothetical protein VFPPC_13055 [Pochonia chlamydosporia 170]OAQ73679.1 hypothetical protein VFPPC_13055 [Pochonia chlamydosporia 170]